MKNRINVVIGLLISAVFVYFAVRRVDPGEVVRSFKKINYLWLLPNMILIISTMLMRAVRWKYLLMPVRSFQTKTLFPPVMIGFMANNVLPVRLGEIIRAYSLGIKTGESRSSIFATVVIERIFDSLALMIMFWLVFLSVTVPPDVRKFGIISLILNAAVVLTLLLLRGRASLLIRIFSIFFAFMPLIVKEKAAKIIRKFVDGLAVFGEYGALGRIALWSLGLWVITALSNYFVFMAFGLYPNPVSSFILLLFVAAAVMLPSAPGFIGVFQVGVIGAFAFMNNMNIIGFELSIENIETFTMMAPAFAHAPAPAIGTLCESLGLAGISKAQSLSFSIVLWLCQYVPVTALGLYYLKREHLSLRSFGEG